MRISKAVLVLTLFLQISFTQWAEQTSGVTTALYSVSAYSNTTAWVCGASGRVLRTSNGGINWIIAASPNAALTMYSICTVNDSTALVTGSSTSTYVYKTSNWGFNWTQVFIQPGGFINGIVHIQESTFGMAGDPVGGRWSLWVSFDEGDTWDSSGIAPLMQSGSEAGWNNSFSIVLNSAWVGTNNSRVYYAPFQAQSWIIEPTPGLINSYAVWFNDTAAGMTGGPPLLYTTNSGINWTTLTAPGTGNILGIAGELISNNWCYVRGSSIYCSTNNGASWMLQYTASSGIYQHISLARFGTYHWAVRNNGTITRGTGLVTAIEPIVSEIPDKFYLHQNYPNPFNPATVINYSVPKSSFVTIKIYDLLGKEIKTLVSSQHNTGNYTETFDGSELASGIYYYTMNADEFSLTRKMILMK